MKKTIQKSLFIAVCIICLIWYYQSPFKSYMVDKKKWNETYLPMFDQNDSLTAQLLLLDTVGRYADSGSVRKNQDMKRIIINEKTIVLSKLLGPEGPQTGFEGWVTIVFPVLSIFGFLLFILIMAPMGSSIWLKD